MGCIEPTKCIPTFIKNNSRFAKSLINVYNVVSKTAWSMLTATGLEPRITLFVNERSTIWPNCGFTLKRVRDMTRTYSQWSMLLIFFV